MRILKSTGQGCCGDEVLPPSPRCLVGRNQTMRPSPSATAPPPTRPVGEPESPILIAGLPGSIAKTLGENHTLFVKANWRAPSLAT